MFAPHWKIREGKVQFCTQNYMLSYLPEYKKSLKSYLWQGSKAFFTCIIISLILWEWFYFCDILKMRKLNERLAQIWIQVCLMSNIFWTSAWFLFCTGENEYQNESSSRALGFLPCWVLDPSNIVSLIWKMSCQINLCISNSAWHREVLTPCAANWMGSGGQGWCLKMILATSVDTSRGVCQLYGFSRGIDVQDSGAQSSLPTILVPPPPRQCPLQSFH